MPNVPVVDAHVHLWDPEYFRMSWLDGNPLLNQPYGLAEYRRATEDVDVEALVYLQVEVEPPYALLEAQWVADRVREEPRIAAIVPWAPLEYGEQARAFLRALLAISPRIKGIRRIIQFEPDLDFCRQPRFVRGVQILSEYDLSFDICIDHRHLANTVELVRQCPDTSFILDHIAKPNIRDHVLDPWRAHISELASFPNVVCKISGLVVEADRAHWTPEDLRPYVEHIIASFGEDRILFGGDWPVVLEAASLRRWIATLDDLTGNLSTEARRKLWADNARRVYRIPSTPETVSGAGEETVRSGI